MAGRCLPPRWLQSMVVAAGLWWAAAATTWGAGIELVVVTESGFSALETQKWSQMLAGLRLGSFRIRAMSPGDKPEVKATGKPGTGDYRVVGVLSARGGLTLPGGKFDLKDTKRLAQYFDDLKTSGPPGAPAARPKLFGLEDADLELVRQNLSSTVSDTTLEKGALEIVAAIAQQLGTKLQIDRAASSALATTMPLKEELKGVAIGTALAYVLRPAGMGFAPQRVDGKLAYRVYEPTQDDLPWPIGVSAEAERDKLVPKLLDTLDVEIDNPLPDVLAAFSERLEVRCLYDHNALAIRKIALEKVMVKIAPKRSSYVIVLRQALSKGRLKYETRVDEAGQPFLWITTMIPVD